MNIELHYAQVIENDSTKSPEGIKNNSIQIKIPYLMSGVTDSTQLPWAMPFSLSTGGSATYGISCIPEKNSLIWVFFYDNLLQKKLYYIADITLQDLNAAALFETNVKSNISGFSSSYPDIKNITFKNGINIAVSSNSSNPEVSIYHPQGSYIFINKSGEIHIKAGTATLEKTLLGETLKGLLEQILDAINAITVPTGVGPSGTPINAATFTNIKSQLSTALSQKVKNN